MKPETKARHDFYKKLSEERKLETLKFLVKENERPEYLLKKRRVSKTRKPATKYFIYLIGSNQYPWRKIGISKSPDTRLKTILTSLPFDVDILEKHHIPGGKIEALRAERYVHKNFSDRKTTREWFTSITIEEFTQAVKDYY